MKLPMGNKHRNTSFNDKQPTTIHINDKLPCHELCDTVSTTRSLSTIIDSYSTPTSSVKSISSIHSNDNNNSLELQHRSISLPPCDNYDAIRCFGAPVRLDGHAIAIRMHLQKLNQQYYINNNTTTTQQLSNKQLFRSISSSTAVEHGNLLELRERRSRSISPPQIVTHTMTDNKVI